MKNLWSLEGILGLVCGFIFSCVIMVGVVVLIIRFSAYGPVSPPAPTGPAITQPHQVTPLKHKPHGRPIYAGGIHNLTDLYNAMHDPYVADNFEGFNFSSAHLVKLNRSVLAFVTFEVDGRGVFWAARAILLPAGEVVWTDDQGNYLRAKCGNRIAYAPGLRVAPEEEVPEEALVLPPVVSPVVPIFVHETPIRPVPPPHAFYPQPPPIGQPWGPRHGAPFSFASNPMPGWEIGLWIFLLAMLTRKALREKKNYGNFCVSRTAGSMASKLENRTNTKEISERKL